jgi:hypothetical protein
MDCFRQNFSETAINWNYTTGDFDEFHRTHWPVIDSVPGALTCLEAFFLYKSAKGVNNSVRDIDQPLPKFVVEIGSYMGRSSVAIGLGLKERDAQETVVKLVCVDPLFNCKNSDLNVGRIFFENIKRAEVSEFVEMMPGFSADVFDDWNKTDGIAMLWIDGNHESEFVEKDINLWSQYLVPGGLIICHDWYLLGVQEVVKRLIFGVPHFQNCCAINGNLIAGTRVDVPPSASQRAQKRRLYLTLRSGNRSALSHLAYIVLDVVDKPFGSFLKFFSVPPSLQEPLYLESSSKEEVNEERRPSR